MLQVDWLQLNIRNTGNGFKLHPDFELVDLNKPNSIFAKLYEWRYKGEKIGLLQAEPHSAIIDKNTLILQVENKLLYNSGIGVIMQNYLACNNWEFKGFTRLDIAFDFNHFKDGLHPQEFIKQFLSGQVRKTDKTKISTVAESGEHEGLHLLQYEYIRFGSGKSDLTYYLYNKSKELLDVKDKPYIREKWLKSGLKNVFDVWRLEFRIRGNQKMIVDTFTGESKTLREFGLDLLQPKSLETLFFSLAEKYFDFRYHTHQANVSRLPRIELFTFKPYGSVIASVPKKDSSGRADKVFIKKLCFLDAELIRQGMVNYHEERYLRNLITYKIVKHDLISWAKHKEFVPDECIRGQSDLFTSAMSSCSILQ